MIPALLGLAFAHGVDAGVLLVDVHGPVARLAATPTAALFPDQDLDHDGLLDMHEVEVGREAILDRVRAQVHLRDGHGRAGREELADVVVPEAFDADRPGGRPHLRVILSWRWEEPPEALALDWELFGGLDDPALTLLTTRDGQTVGAWTKVGPLDSHHQLYGEPASGGPLGLAWVLAVPLLGLLLRGQQG